MKIHLLSDLHFEHWKLVGDVYAPIEYIPAYSDVLVLAGDIIQGAALNKEEITTILKRLRDKAEYVLYVPGNHEYYEGDRKKDWTQFTSQIEEICLELKISFMRRDSVLIRGIRFHGCTLWYGETRSTQEYFSRWSDKQWIGFTLKQAAEENKKDREFLEANVRMGDVVITHMLPSFKSVHPMYAGSKINCYYVTDLEEEIKKLAPQLWMHGHTHIPCDYKIGLTRVVASPFGYPSEAPATHRLEKCIEIPG